TSPPGRTGTWRSHIRVPKSADSTFDGTQYRSSPGSRKGLTTTTRQPRRLAMSRYFMKTGWLFAGFAPQSTTRSLSMTSVREQVDAATPMDAFSPSVDGAWHTRAAESIDAMPRARAALP